MASAPECIDKILELLSSEETIAAGDDSLVQAINFLHSVSLKEGEVRSTKMPKVLQSFLSSIFSNDKFCDCL
jgi:hypothetical protein